MKTDAEMLVHFCAAYFERSLAPVSETVAVSFGVFDIAATCIVH